MLVSSSFARQPLLAVVLVFGLLVAFGALILRLQDVLFGEPSGPAGGVKAAYVPLFIHLAIVLVAGHMAAGAGGALVPRRRGAARVSAMSERLTALAREPHPGRRAPAVAALRGR